MSENEGRKPESVADTDFRKQAEQAARAGVEAMAPLNGVLEQLLALDLGEDLNASLRASADDFRRWVKPKVMAAKDTEVVALAEEAIAIGVAQAATAFERELLKVTGEHQPVAAKALEEMADLARRFNPRFVIESKEESR